MVYDIVIMGAGLAGFSAALAALKQGKQALIVAKGLGNLYSSSGYVDLLGYYPQASHEPVLNPSTALNKLLVENPNHPYGLIGKEYISDAFSQFLNISNAMSLPYTGSLDRNVLMPTAAGALVPTTLYPCTAEKDVTKAKEIVVVGIKELMDFYPMYVSHNLEKQLQGKVKVSPVWIELGLNAKRELNSYDLALYLEKAEIRAKLIKQLANINVKNTLLLIPAVLGVNKWVEVIDDIETNLKCQVLEIPTLPPSVMGYRLAEALKKYLQKRGVEFLIGYPITYSNCKNSKCEEIGITVANNRLKKIKGKNFVLATGGILGEGLQVAPTDIKEKVYDLPVITPQRLIADDFFDLEGQLLAYAGVNVNNMLQPVDQENRVLLENVFVAGATLAGYDPFIEKSGNGVALASGYKAGILAGQEGN